MKRIVLILAVLIISGNAHAQTTLLTEDFETVDSCIAYGGQILDWTQYSSLSTSGTNSMFGGIYGLPGDTLFLRTISFSTMGYSNILLEFNHIAKVEFWDGGFIDISIDSGITWTPLNDTNCVYAGASTAQVVWNSYSKFCAASYPVWQPSSQNATPNNTWWVHEIFDVSALAMNHSNVMFRFKIFDGNGNGSFSNFGWLVDDLSIKGSCGLTIAPITTNVSCNGGSDGSVSLIVSNGTAPYTYQWSSGQTTSTVTGLTSGTYNVIVTDSNACVGAVNFAITQPSKITVSGSSTQTNCGQNTGILSIIVTGGTPPYIYLWSNSATTASINNLAAGAYSITVTDMNGCTGSGTGIVNSVGGAIMNIDSIINPICSSTNGGIYLSVSGTGPFTFQWNNGSTTEDNNNLTGGTYTITVTDSSNCQTISSYNITSQLPNASIVIQNAPSSCIVCDGILVAYASGGTLPYTYKWDGGTSTQTAGNLCTGYYNCLIMDAAGCSINIGTNLQTNLFAATATSSPSGCGLNNGSATCSVAGGVPPFTFLWSQGSVTQTITNLDAGIYSVWIQDANNCFAFSTVVVDDSCHGVWPGDANYDLKVDNNDLLNIGVGYSATGPVRSGASMAWVAQQCSDWSQYFVAGANYKNADCNGDGVIDDNDTTAIILNYGLSHSFIIPPQNNSFLLPVPDLYLVVTSDTTGLSDTITIQVNLGNVTLPVDSIYGLAFSINFDPALIDTGSGSVDFSNCWVGTQSVNMLTLYKDRSSDGALDIALVRKDQLNVSGSGAIALATVVTTDNIAGTRSTTRNLKFSLSGVRGILADESALLFNGVGDSIVIDSSFVAGIQSYNNLEKYITISPNPASQTVTVHCKFSETGKWQVEICDVIGKIIFNSGSKKQNTTLQTDISSLSNGIYFVNVKTDKGMVSKKLVVQH